MAKIVIIAPAEATSDVDDAAKMLRGNGHDVDIEQPVPKNLLHIVLGLLGPNAYGFGPGYAYSPGADADAADGDGDDEEAIEDETTADPVEGEEDMFDLDGQGDVEIPDGGDDFNFESVTVDGEAIDVVLSDLPGSTLIVEKMILGPKTTYLINESAFSFWPADANEPRQRVDVGASSVHTSVEVAVTQGEKQALYIGKDLQEILKIKPREKLAK